MQRLDLGTNNVSTLEQGNYWLICEEYYYMFTFIAPRYKKPKLLKEPKKTPKQKGKKKKSREGNGEGNRSIPQIPTGSSQSFNPYNL